MKSSGIQYDYGFRIYDARIGKFLSIDPLSPDYPWYTPYQFAGNMPIYAMDLDGLEPKSMVTLTSDGTYKFTEPAIVLLSWLSGVEESLIRDVRVKERAPIPFGVPWTKVGGLTTKDLIRLTPNFFELIIASHNISLIRDNPY